MSVLLVGLVDDVVVVGALAFDVRDGVQLPLATLLEVRVDRLWAARRDVVERRPVERLGEIALRLEGLGVGHAALAREVLERLAGEVLEAAAERDALADEFCGTLGRDTDLVAA